MTAYCRSPQLELTMAKEVDARFDNIIFAYN